MKTFLLSVKRNTKLFFKDKAMFFTSLITPLILLLLYGTFLFNVYKDSFVQSLNGINVEASLIDGLVSGQLLSSLLAVSCITVAFCSNILMVQDKITLARNDMLITPAKKSTLALSYFVSSLISTLIICMVGYVGTLIYVAVVGWYMSFVDCLLVALDVIILTTFGTALSSVIYFFLTSQGQISAIGTIVSACYGFICGAYMPISSFSKGLQNVIMFLPGTYGTALIRNHAMNGALKKCGELFPAEVIVNMRDSIDCNIYFLEHEISQGAMYGIMIGSIIILVGIYVLMNVIKYKKARR